MRAREHQDGPTHGRAGQDRVRRPALPRVSRSAVLAVSLSLLTLLSVFAVPAAGSSTDGSASAGSVDVGVDVPAPLAKANPSGNRGGGNPGGQSGGNGGSNGNNGGSSSDNGGGSTNEEAGSSAGGGSSGGGNASSQSNGNAGSNGQSNGNGASTGGAGGKSTGPNDAPTIDIEGAGPDIDVGSIPWNDGAGQSNAGGNGNGAPADSNAGGNGNGASVSVSAGVPGEQGPEGVSATAGSTTPTSVASVAVEGARAGEHLDLDVSPSESEDDPVAFDGISVTVERGGDFTMQVTNSLEPLPGSPAFEPGQAAESLGRIRLDHSITNEEVDDVSYTFRVSKAHLRETGTDPEDVALFRYADDEWTELPTDVVGETETHYILTSDSPGMSEFAVGAKRPDFDTFWAKVDAGSVDAGDTVTVRGRVTNDGGADGVYDAMLVVDGRTVATRSITIAAGGTRQINFRTELDRPGDRRISINGVSAGDVSVADQSVVQPDEPAAEREDHALTIVLERLLDVSRALGVTAP